jgi:hypothetical protein
VRRGVGYLCVAVEWINVCPLVGRPAHKAAKRVSAHMLRPRLPSHRGVMLSCGYALPHPPQP